MTGHPSGEDHLPWLEAVDSDTAPIAIPPVRQLARLLLIVAAVVVVIAAGFWMKATLSRPEGDGTLIRAPIGPYKVRPQHSGGMTVEGSGDVTYGVSEGEEAVSALDIDNHIETPIASRGRKSAAPTTPNGQAGTSVTMAVVSGGRLDMSAQRRVMGGGAGSSVSANGSQADAAATANSGIIHLGAFSTPESAEKAWDRLTRRYEPLKSMPKQITPALFNGVTIYRLRTNAGAQAGTACDAIHSIGSSCTIVR